MADPDADTDDEFENSPDYYSILNVRKDVSVQFLGLFQLLLMSRNSTFFIAAQKPNFKL